MVDLYNLLDNTNTNASNASGRRVVENITNGRSNQPPLPPPPPLPSSASPTPSASPSSSSCSAPSFRDFMRRFLPLTAQTTQPVLPPAQPPQQPQQPQPFVSPSAFCMANPQPQPQPPPLQVRSAKRGPPVSPPTPSALANSFIETKSFTFPPLPSQSHSQPQPPLSSPQPNPNIPQTESNPPQTTKRCRFACYWKGSNCS